MVKYYYNKYFAVGGDVYTQYEEAPVISGKGYYSFYMDEHDSGESYQSFYMITKASIDNRTKFQTFADLPSTFFSVYDRTTGAEAYNAISNIPYITASNAYYIVFMDDQNTAYRYLRSRNDGNSPNKAYTAEFDMSAKVLKLTKTGTEYSKGTLVQSNIIAENNTYPNNARHTDGYWYVRGGLVNQEPTITVPTAPFTIYGNPPSFKYTVADADAGQTLTITEKMDGRVIRTLTNVASGTELTYTISALEWLKTRINTKINMEITANDGNGGVKTVTYPITRNSPSSTIRLTTPFETDVKATRILLTMEKSIPVGATLKIEVCNNAFDSSPTWEDASTLFNIGLPYPFQNTTKTATKWGVSFRITLTRGSATGQVSIDGIGGAFE